MAGRSRFRPVELHLARKRRPWASAERVYKCHSRFSVFRPTPIRLVSIGAALLAAAAGSTTGLIYRHSGDAATWLFLSCLSLCLIALAAVISAADDRRGVILKISLRTAELEALAEAKQRMGPGSPGWIPGREADYLQDLVKLVYLGADGEARALKRALVRLGVSFGWPDEP
jgi:hypothetical protein